MKRAGPELKMPDLKHVKVPKFASDLYYDLHDRRLLPLVGLILIAIVAMPFLLGSDSDSEVVETPVAVDGAMAEGAGASSLTVVEAQPGLRDYRKRLSGRTPTDPFKQRFTGAAANTGLPNKDSDSGLTGTGGSGGGASSTPVPSGPSTPPSSTVEPAPTPAPESVPPSAGGGRGDNGDDEIPDGVNLYTYVLDLQITRIETKPNGRVEKTEPKLREDVKAPTPLPGGKAPVVTYLGMGAKKPRLPMFLISPDVTAVYGEANCIAGTDSCQLLALEKGFPVTLVYGENDVRYKINLIDVEPVPIKAVS